MSTATSATDWSTRPVPAGRAAETVGAWVERSVRTAEAMLFTATPREELDEIGRWQQLKDQAFAGQLRAIVAADNRRTREQREFAGDEVGLAIGASPTAGSRLVELARAAASLPGLIEAVEAGMLTERHLRAVINELDAPQTLSIEQRHAVVLVMLARYDNQTPAELGRLVQRLILTVDRAAAQARRDAATRGRNVSSYATADGQGALHAVGPLEHIAAITARLRAELVGQSLDPDDTRTMAQREFDLLAELLTRGTLDDHPMPDWHAQIVVPFSVAEGGDLEVAEVPGFGPILPSTARDLLDQSSSLTQIAVDGDGNVLAVSTPTPGPAEDRSAERGQLPHPTIQALTKPPVRSHLFSRGYRLTRAMVRHLEVRDRTCVFPGCHRRVTDKDHRIPWPLGPTSLYNLQCLCRHHHRAKQAVFRVLLSPEGDYLWITRGGWYFVRRRHRY